MASADSEKQPSVPDGPIPSTTSRVRRNGTVSGVLRHCAHECMPQGKGGWVRNQINKKSTKQGCGLDLGPWITHLALLKNDSEVDVYYLPRLLVDKDVVTMPIADTEDMADNAVDSN